MMKSLANLTSFSMSIEAWGKILVLLYLVILFTYLSSFLIIGTGVKLVWFTYMEDSTDTNNSSSAQKYLH